jgi:predicted regulator of Ras-like GTPase activity (Roadblock/LC7/MglB family)
MSLVYDASESHMSKYDELLSRAVARLPRERPDLRRKMYEHARAALRKQLQDTQPPISEINIAAEERALNEAIERIEMSPKDEGAPVLAPPATQAQNGSGDGRLSELLKRASRDVALALVPKLPLPPPTSPMDFAPRRAQTDQTPSTPNSGFLVTSLQGSEPGAVAAKEPRETKPAPNRENLNSILHKLQAECPGVEASALISEDGSMIASALAANMEEARVAGMAATLQNVGARASMALGRGKTREVIIRGKNGYAILISAGRGAFLLALADESSKLGLIFFNMHEAIKALPAAMESRKAGSE